VAEINLVIEIDGGDDGERRIDYVGRVETPAEADFDHRGIDALLAKEPERHRGYCFEVRRVTIQIQLFSGMVNDLEGLAELLGRYGDTVDLDSLGGLDQVRRGEETCANASGAQTGVDHGAGGPFPVCAGDVNDSKCGLRIAERGEHFADAVESKLGGLDLVAKCVEELDGFGI